MTEDILCDLSSFPTRLVRDALVDTYFKDIHPCFPIIDEADFHRRYADPTDPPPLLIFHAILLAAARISDHPMVAKCREMVTATLFRRAKALFDLRYENDRLHLIQAAFLLAWHTENSDTIASNAYHWIGTAVRIAFGLGVHRGNVGVVAKYLPPSEYGTHRIYKRVWWSLLHAEVFSALEFGRPCMIRADDFDVRGLEDGDFQNMNDSEDNIANRHFCYVMSDLCLVALDILDLHAPRSKTPLINNSTIDHRLAAVALRIPSSHDFWSCQLRINYNLVVLILHRTDNDMDAASLCSESASNVLTTFETMVVQGTIRQCYLTSSTALMAAAIQFSREVKSAIVKGSIMKAVSTHSQLERLQAPAKALSEYWPNVDAVCRLCKSLSARAEGLIKGWHIQNSPSLQNAEFPADMDVVWQDIMADFRGSNFGLGLEVEEWMNISSLRSN
jgi:transcriptional regulatory protein AMDR